ncbi:MAG TPA: aldo/keto reductase [Planctomycetota bacterium]|nr:aldo/keto reductase [Planctomycetota bacterium]
MTLSTYNEIPLPSFLYGTAWKKDATTGLVELAVASGFKGIDTANQLKHYDEARVGEALLTLQKKGVRREDLFLQTKFTSIGGQDQRLPYDPSADPATQVRQSFESSLKHLHTDYLDSYVLHGPTYRRGLAPEDWAVWGAIEELYQAGKTKMIGASNVSAEQLALLCSKAKVKPMLVQNRCFAVMGWDYEVRKLCAQHDVVYEGFSLLTANQEFFGAPELHAIAQRVGAGVAQVIFRFAQQVGMLPLTGTTNPQHMKEDLACDRFTLTPEELQQVETIGVR